MGKQSMQKDNTTHRNGWRRVVLCVLVAVVLGIGLMPTVPLGQIAWASSTASTPSDATLSAWASTPADADTSDAYAQATDENGQTTVIIGDPENDPTSNMVPFASWTDLATMATLYTADEIGQEGDIASLSFYVASAAQTSIETSLDIYVCMTDLTTFPSSTGSLFEEGDLTLVYSNDSVVMGQEVGWETWEFDETFYYDGTSNLIVVTAHSQEESPGDYTYAYTTINTSVRTTYRANSANSSNPERYTDPYYSGIYWMPGNHGDKRADMRLTFGDKLTSDLFEVDTSSETYTGEEITKAITTDLVEDVDYQVEYSNNINAGEATITITGLGTYVGTLTYTFDILPASILNADISGIESSYVYTGEEIVPEPTVTLNGRTLHRGTDYHVIYSNNIDIGSASVTISAIGNYTDSVTVPFEIVEPEPVTYTVVFDSRGGSSVESQVVVKGQCAEEPPAPSRDGFVFTGWYIDEDCTQPFDFAEPITDNITLYAGWDAESDPSPGPTPEPTPEPSPDPDPEPTPTPTVTKITQDMFIVDTSSATYTGFPIEKEVASPLTDGVDYEVTYEDNTDVGTATITITGIGNYDGTLTYTFDIMRAFVRLAGDDRYGTMEAIDDEGFTSADTVVLTAGNNFPDALAAAGLAGTLNAPVLLTDTATLSAATAEEIARLGASNVVIVGGENSVSAAVVQTLAAMGINVTRVAGTDRYETALEAYYAGEGDWGTSGNGTAKTAIIAAGASFPDTLSASSYAWWATAPIFLTSSTGLDEATKTAITSGGFERIIIVGGSALVSASVEAWAYEIAPTERLAGDDRYDTSVEFAAWAAGEGMSFHNAGIATGKNFPDALAGGALCGQRGSVLLLADVDGGIQAVDLLAEHKDEIMRIYFLGGIGSVTSELTELIEASLG